MVSVNTSLPAGDRVSQADLEHWLDSLTPDFSKADKAYLREAADLALQAGAETRVFTGESQLRVQGYLTSDQVAEVLDAVRALQVGAHGD